MVLACRIDSPSRLFSTVYLDGAQAASANVPDVGINGCASRKLRFGTDQGGGQRLNGAVDRIAIFPRLLTPGEITGWQELAGL